MHLDIFFVGFVVDVIEIELLAHVHAPHSGARDETYLGQHVLGQLCFFQSLTQGQHTHQRSTCSDGILWDTQTLTHLRIGQLHLTNGKLLVFRLEITQLPHPRLAAE